MSSLRLFLIMAIIIAVSGFMMPSSAPFGQVGRVCHSQPLQRTQRLPGGLRAGFCVPTSQPTRGSHGVVRMGEGEGEGKEDEIEYFDQGGAESKSEKKELGRVEEVRRLSLSTHVISASPYIPWSGICHPPACAKWRCQSRIIPIPPLFTCRAPFSRKLPNFFLKPDWLFDSTRYTAQLGLFPLGLVLNPGAALPLHIFEMRYRNLFSKAWEDNKRVRRPPSHSPTH